MADRIKIVGVYPVEADEPVHLIEALINEPFEDFDFGAITQEALGEYCENWQVPYDEQLVEESSGNLRVPFFFHYLDFDQPLLTPQGPLQLPVPTRLPEHLLHLQYVPP